MSVDYIGASTIKYPRNIIGSLYQGFPTIYINLTLGDLGSFFFEYYL